MIEKDKIVRAVKILLVIIFFITIFYIVEYIMKQYEIKGETNMPFEIKKIITISTAKGIDKNSQTSTWAFNIVQINDIYINIGKNEKYMKNDAIQEVILDNFKIIEEPRTGTVNFFRNDTGIYTYEQGEIIETETKFDTENEILNETMNLNTQGGTICFRIANNNIADFISNDGEELIHDGTIIKRINISEEEITFKVSFDILLKLSSQKSFKATIELNLPNEGITTQGIVSKEITKFDNVIFKRITN